MTLLEMKKKVLSLIEELNPDSEFLTDDPDIAAKLNEVINQIMFELARFKKIPMYVETAVKKDQVLTFDDLGALAGAEVYQIALISGVDYLLKANNSRIKFREDGTAEMDLFVYPERITEKTKDKAYTFELSQDALEIMPYGVAGVLLMSDVSANYGRNYSDMYMQKLQLLDSRYATGFVTVEGGVTI